MNRSDICMIGQGAFDSISRLLDIWLDTFGEGFEAIWNANSHLLSVGAEEESTHASLVNFVRRDHLVAILNCARNRLNAARGFQGDDASRGHASLLVREPLTDRLLLIASTNPDLCPPVELASMGQYGIGNSNLDYSSNIVYYDLCDRLAPAEKKRDPDARRTRGLTGWVAVTGQALIINNERDERHLEDVSVDNPQAVVACEKYGYPAWGSHVSEFPKPKRRRAFDKRLLVVPMRQISADNSWMGVVRYCCYRGGAQRLDGLDLAFLRSITQVIACLINIGRVRVVSERNHVLPHAKAQLRDSGDVRRFLSFMARGLRSRIASTYIFLELGRPVLRLFDAVGISGDVGPLRSQGEIKDYDEDHRGLTWGLLEADSITLFENVIRGHNWAGRNDRIFYQRVLESMGVAAIAEWSADPVRARSLLQAYTIKLLGTPLRTDDEERVGVLKVEFPATVDMAQHYNEADRSFFQGCAQAIAREMAGYKAFVEGRWFKPPRSDGAAEFAKYFRGVVATQLVDADEAPLFWSAANDYIAKNKVALQELLPDLVMTRVGEGERPYFERIKKIMPEARWFVQTLFEKGIEALVRVATGV